MTDYKNLFREQVFTARSEASSKFGRPIAMVPSQWTAYIIFVAVVLILSFITSFFVEFSRKESVRGKLTYSSAEARIYPDQPGILSELFVLDGQPVEKGDTLAIINQERFLVDGSNVSQMSQELIRQQIKSAYNRKLNHFSTAKLEREILLEKIETLKHQTSRNKTAIEELLQQEQSEKEQMDKLSDLFKKRLITNDILRNQKNTLRNIRNNRLQMADTLASNQSQLRELNLRYKQQNIESSIQLTQIDNDIAQLENQKVQSSSSSGYRLIAPINGIVTSLKVKQGEPVFTSDFLLAVVPDKSKLVAELFLPSSAIGFIKVGQAIKVKYDAFPYLKFGFGRGEIAAIASVALPASELDIVNNSNFFFRIEALIDQGFSTQLDNEIILQSGMEFSADIILNRQRVIEWLLSHIFHNI